MANRRFGFRKEICSGIRVMKISKKQELTLLPLTSKTRIFIYILCIFFAGLIYFNLPPLKKIDQSTIDSIITIGMDRTSVYRALNLAGFRQRDTTQAIIMYTRSRAELIKKNNLVTFTKNYWVLSLRELLCTNNAMLWLVFEEDRLIKIDFDNKVTSL
jgi:hypothetical protein